MIVLYASLAVIKIIEISGTEKSFSSNFSGISDILNDKFITFFNYKSIVMDGTRVVQFECPSKLLEQVDTKIKTDEIHAHRTDLLRYLLRKYVEAE